MNNQPRFEYLIRGILDVLWEKFNEEWKSRFPEEALPLPLNIHFEINDRQIVGNAYTTVAFTYSSMQKLEKAASASLVAFSNELKVQALIAFSNEIETVIQNKEEKYMRIEADFESYFACAFPKSDYSLIIASGEDASHENPEFFEEHWSMVFKVVINLGESLAIIKTPA